MEETRVSKRHREETQLEKEEDIEEYSKRHKPYNHILSLLESEEEEPTEDLSSLITTLQQEISNSDTFLSQTPENHQHNPTLATLEEQSDSTSSSDSGSKGNTILKEDEEEEGDKERVMRHLLEASDDELGIPNTGDGLLDFGFNGGGDGYPFSDWLWELEDETANYYTLLQSQLFM